MKKFIISTHSFDFGIGGLKVLHKLCHLLNENGYDAYLIPVRFDLPFESYDKYNVKMVTEEVLSNIDDCIVVYPESWFGNYLNAKNVVRWMIGFPSELHIKTWSDKDLWFWYIPEYITQVHNKNKENFLYVGETHKDIFYNKNLNRDINCWTLRKAQDFIKPDQYVHPKDSFFIPYHAAGDLFNLSLIFNKSTDFYCYDNYTYLSIQALMCGTNSIVIPNKLTKEQFLSGFELNKYVAFGIDDLNRAKNIRNEFESSLNELEKKTTIQIHEFVNKCYDYFK